MLSARLFLATSQDGRSAERRPLGAPATMHNVTEMPITVAVRDLSSTDVRFDRAGTRRRAYPRWVHVALLAGGSILGWWLILTLLG